MQAPLEQAKAKALCIQLCAQGSHELIVSRQMEVRGTLVCQMEWYAVYCGVDYA
jgi:hypothetical protein